MDELPTNEKVKQIHIATGDELSRGRYSNSMIASHTEDEFILDWLFNSPNGVHLVSRVIVSPGHIKRIIGALKENLDNYEKQFGSARETQSGIQKIH
jgi:hypothetical protein